MRSLIGALHDLLFPPHCLHCGLRLDHSLPPVLCPGCLDGLQPLHSPWCTCCGLPYAAGEDHLCGTCLGPDPYAFDFARSPFLYQPPISSLLLALKFANRTDSLTPLGTLSAASGVLAVFSEPDIILPVPLHITRLRQRGFNQALLLARHCFPQWRDRIAPSLLIRTRATAPQSSLSGRERRRNCSGCFALTDASSVADKKVLLVDDVFTTGSTLNECARTVGRHNPERIEVFAVARSLKK